MAAFTEGFTDTSQPGKDHIGAMISKVMAARKFAREERELAEEKAKKAGYDSLEEVGVEKGFFFKAALKSKFGGSYLSGKKQDIKQTVDRVKLLRNPKAQFWNFIDNRDAEGKEIKKLSDVERFRAQFDNYAFVSAKRPPENVEPQEEMVPDTADETASSASGGGKRRVTREDILTAVSAIASSLEKTAQSINNTIGETKVIADGVQAIKSDVVTQLSERTDSIEAKLDAIVAAINAQTDLQKKMTDDAETSKSITTSKQQGDAADSGDFDDLSTDKDESADDKLGSELDLGDPSPAATSAQDIEFQQQQAYQEREAGGIVSGPDEGYLAKLHGDEMVIPLDNNYTQGQPSAMDGKVRPVPQTSKFSTQSYETGTPSKPPVASSLGSKVGFTNLDLGMGSKSDSAADSMAQPLMDAMSLPMMVAGGTILSSVNQLMTQLGPENADVAGEIAKVARPIADVFGLPNNLVNKASGGMGKKEGDEDKDRENKEEKKEKKGLFSNLMETLKKAMGRGGGGGGGGGGSPAGPPSSPNFTGEGGDKAMNYLMSQGLTKEQAAGVAGNLQQESTFNPKADNTGTGENDTAGHYGIAQWDKVHRWPKVKQWMVEQGLDPYSLEGQLQAMVWEAKQRGDWSKLKEVTDADAAARSWLKNYERSGEEPGDPGYDARIANARRWAQKELPTTGPNERPTVTNNPDDVKPNSAPEIKQNFGLTTGQTFDFSVPGKGNFQAYKTTTGFEIFKYGGVGALVGRNERMDTSDGKNPWLVQALIKAGKERQQAAATAKQTVTPPGGANGQTPQQIASAKQESLRTPSRTDRRKRSSTAVVALNSGGATKPTSNSPKPDAQGQVVGEGSGNGLEDMYPSQTRVTGS